MGWIEVVRQFFWWLWSFLQSIIPFLEEDLALYGGVDFFGTFLMLSGIYTLTRNKFVGAILLVLASFAAAKVNTQTGSYIYIVGNVSMLAINLYTIYQEIRVHQLTKAKARAEVEAKVAEALRMANYALPATELQEVNLPLNLQTAQQDLVEIEFQDLTPAQATYADVTEITEALFTLAENEEASQLV